MEFLQRRAINWYIEQKTNSAYVAKDVLDTSL